MMTDHAEQNSLRLQPTSSEEPETSVESTNNEAIATLVNGIPLFDPNTINNSRDDSPQPVRRRSSVSIIQALVNTSHLLTTNDARKR
jgi:hypothetical protein